MQVCSSSSVFPAISLGFDIFSEIFVYVTVFCLFFLNSTIEVVTFCICGWCMLGVFFFAASIQLTHEWQDHLSPCMECMCAQTRPRLCSHPKSFGGMEVETVLTPMQKLPLLEAQCRVEPARLHHAGQRNQHTTYRAILAPESWVRSLDLLLSRRATLYLRCILHKQPRKEMIMIKIAFKGAIRDFFDNLQTAPRTVSNTYTLVAWAQLCTNFVQHIQRLSHATCRVKCHVVRRDSSAVKSDRVEIAFI